jgi:geranylgeranyl pyrophosphate synthase
MELNQIYQPIGKELKEVEEILGISLQDSKNESILRLNRFLLESPGKRIRPALVILSYKTALGNQSFSPPSVTEAINHKLLKIASAIELIHLASLIHDDVIDCAALRHHKPSIYSKYGEAVSIALGDYLYSRAFELISFCGNIDVLLCVSQATRLMCEGELWQVCERDNIDCLKERYIIMVRNKTASLFAASCQAGAMLSKSQKPLLHALKGYGLNFGIAFQIADDCLDLIGEAKELGKTPGADFKMGELTLPVLNLLSESKDKNRLLSLIRQRDTKAFRELRQRFIDSKAALRTKRYILSYVWKAKKGLEPVAESSFKKGLFELADFIMERLNGTA